MKRNKFLDAMMPQAMKSDIRIPKRCINTKDFHVKNKSNGSVVVEGFANTATVDRGNELLLKEDWDLKNYEKNPVMLFNHDWNMIIGGNAKAVPQSDGLEFKAEVSKSENGPVPYIRDMITEGFLKMFSVSFDDHEQTYEEKGVLRFKRAELLEVSAVTIPMNADSGFSVKNKALDLYRSKSYHDCLAKVCNQKGHLMASRLHDSIDMAMRTVDGWDRDEALARVMEIAKISEQELKSVLSGESEASEAFIKAFSLVFMIPTYYLRWDAEDDQWAEEQYAAKKEEEPKASKDEASEKNAKVVNIREKLKKKSEDSKEEESSSESDGGGSSNDKDFQDCVSEKVPSKIDGGMDPADAVKEAYAECKGNEKCFLPDNDILEEMKDLVAKGHEPSEAVLDIAVKYPAVEPLLDTLLLYAENVNTKSSDKIGDEIPKSEKQADQDDVDPDTGGAAIDLKAFDNQEANPYIQIAQSQLGQLSMLNIKMQDMGDTVSKALGAFGEGMAKASEAMQNLSSSLDAFTESQKSAEPKEGEEGEESQSEEDAEIEKMHQALDQLNNKMSNLRKKFILGDQDED